MSLPLITTAVDGFFLPLGHQGGWDEILLVVAPLLLIGLLLYVANRRVNAQLEQAQDAAGADFEPESLETDARSETAETAGSEDSPA